MFSTTKLQHDQALDFVRSLKKDLSKLSQSLETKHEQYLGGGKGDENECENKNFKFIANTLVEGVKRVIESIQKRIDSFVFYSNSNGSLVSTNTNGQHYSSNPTKVQVVEAFDVRSLNSHYISKTLSQDKLSHAELYSTLIQKENQQLSSRY